VTFLGVIGKEGGQRARRIAELASALDIEAMWTCDPVDERLYEAEYIHLADCDPKECLAIAERARRKKKRLGLDPGRTIEDFDPEQFEHVLRHSTFLFLGGQHTKKALHHIQTKASPEDLLIFVDAVIVTCSAGTATLYAGNHAHELSASFGRSPARTDHAAFEDGFRAGFYAALGHGMRLQLCGRAAMECAAACATGRVPTWMDIVIGL
jgi:sugar/nucleoside kinase (ribokinase family)